MFSILSLFLSILMVIAKHNDKFIEIVKILNEGDLN